MVGGVGDQPARAHQARQRVVGVARDLAVDGVRRGDDAAQLCVRPRPRLGHRRQHRAPAGRQDRAGRPARSRTVNSSAVSTSSAIHGRSFEPGRARRRVAPREVLVVELDVGELAGRRCERAVGGLRAQDRRRLDVGDVGRAEDRDVALDRRRARRPAPGTATVRQRELDGQGRAPGGAGVRGRCRACRRSRSRRRRRGAAMARRCTQAASWASGTICRSSATPARDQRRASLLARRCARRARRRPRRAATAPCSSSGRRSPMRATAYRSAAGPMSRTDPRWASRARDLDAADEPMTPPRRERLEHAWSGPPVPRAGCRRGRRVELDRLVLDRPADDRVGGEGVAVGRLDARRALLERGCAELVGVRQLVERRRARTRRSRRACRRPVRSRRRRPRRCAARERRRCSRRSASRCRTA